MVRPVNTAVPIPRSGAVPDAGPTLEACYQAHRGHVFHVCLRYGAGDAAFAEEVTQDVFLKLMEHLPRLRDPHDLRGWLHRVAANLAISRLRRERSLVGKLRALWSVSAAAPPADAAVGDDARRALETLRDLPPRERVVICMRLLDGASQREIARTLGLSEGYVSKLIQRGRRRIADAGWEVDDVEP